jgi:hypothetical protein
MIRFIENIGDYFSQHFFNEDFPKKVFDKAGYVTRKKDDDGQAIENHVSTINSKVAPLREKYFRFKNEYLSIQRTKDRVKLTHDFHNELLKILDYKNGIQEYESPVYLNDHEEIPVRYQYHKGDKPYLFIMEMKAMIKEGDDEPEGIYDQIYLKEEWEKVFPEGWKDVQIKPDIINEALTELFILSEDERPEYLIMLAAPKIFLIHYEKWKYDSFLSFDLEELFTESQVAANRDYLSLFYALLSKPQFISDTDSILHILEEDAHKSMYGVTQALKNSVVFAVESLANEAIHYKFKTAKDFDEKGEIEALMASDTFARELKDECLTFVYRLLFLFYAESREDLEILPVKDSVYQKGYSLEMLRDLEMVPLTTTSSRDGHFFSESLWKLVNYLHKGQENENGFTMKPLDSPLFDNSVMEHLQGVQFRNYILQEIILRLSLSERTRKKGRGRISYANLGINQLGSVYESLLAYSGFFASETLIEVKAATDKDGKEGTFLVPKKRRDDFEEDEILKDPESPERDVEVEKGSFVYRLNGRDRKKTASYYTPEVLTQTTVKYTLKGILDKLKERQANGEECADEILQLKILEPAMGAAAFQNEVINQLSVAYMELKENEVVKKGGKRIVPGEYKNEIQKVKAYIASHNVYGVDLNPTAIELGKLSLWLNCMHKDMETPFFAHRLGVGNAVVGAWLKVYNPKDFIVEFPREGTPAQRKTPVPKSWWNSAPQRVSWTNGKLNRKEDQIYHFLLPDDNMVPSAGIKMLKNELSRAELKAFNAWKKDFKAPVRGEEHLRLKKICAVIDVLLEEHYLQTIIINKETTSHYNLYGQEEPALDFKNYKEKERLAKLRDDRSAPYFKLKTIMDYWCSLWFWDVRKIQGLPTREQWHNEVESILSLDIEKLSVPDLGSQERTGFEDPHPRQNDLFGSPKQMTIGNSRIRAYDQPQRIRQLIAEHSSDPSSLYLHDRIKYIQTLSNKQKYFHIELEFIEVFKIKSGFDIQVGNPPWVKLEFQEAELISEQFPEIIIRKEKANEVSQRRSVYISSNYKKQDYEMEYIDAEGTSTFMNAFQNYSLLKGQQTDIFRSIIAQSFIQSNNSGRIGLIHPISIFDDPKGKLWRKEAYQRLKYHFQFKNELKLFDIHHENIYSINIYSGKLSSVTFNSIHNLFHPNTIDQSFIHNGTGSPGGIKKKNEIGKYIWNTDPHRHRVLTYGPDQLKLLASTFEDSDEWDSTKLVSIHSTEVLSVIEKIALFPRKINHFENKITVCWDETNDINKNIKRSTRYPDYDQYELILNGPHFFVANPLYKSPREKCVKNQDYDNILLDRIDSNYLPRTNYLPYSALNKFKSTISGFSSSTPWIDLYKVGMSKMISLTGERSLQSAIIPPKVSHVHGVISITFKNVSELIEFAGLSSSLVFDFLIKTIGSANLTDNKIKYLPLGVDAKFYGKIALRALLLNCLTSFYSELWRNNFHTSYKLDKWSKDDYRLKPFTPLEKEWSFNTPLKNFFERRQALIELDVLVAFALNLSLEELILIYKIQFPVLQSYEENTYYDSRGEIVFTNNSQGLRGIGVNTKTWNEIKGLPKGFTHEEIILNNRLYKSQNIIYYAPFDKCDRVEDYKTAWKHFEKVFAELNK